jgi:HSP20 family protein
MAYVVPSRGRGRTNGLVHTSKNEERKMDAPTKKRRGAHVSPWRELEEFGNRIGRWMDDPSLFEQRGFMTPAFAAPFLTESTEWAPAVEVTESDTEYVLTAEIPGMTKEDVAISVDENVLTLKGEKKLEHEEERDRWHIREREYGMFERSFTLPQKILAEKITAAYHDGVVEIHVPKDPSAKGRRIEIA